MWIFLFFVDALRLKGTKAGVARISFRSVTGCRRGTESRSEWRK